MEGHVQPGAYKDVVLFLATAGVVVPLFRRWRVSPILGFLGAGVVLGPYGLGSLAHEVEWLRAFTIDNPAQLAQLAELGVVFLLFMIGLELSWERLRSLRRYVFGLGALQVGLCLTVVRQGTEGLPSGARQQTLTREISPRRLMSATRGQRGCRAGAPQSIAKWN
jgi:CPA2 family monovalent cation:H+ antiporter-2